MSLGERKYFLDWLRVVAFALLILFHIGMLYVTWYYNLKSPRLYPDFELAMNSLSAWGESRKTWTSAFFPEGKAT